MRCLSDPGEKCKQVVGVTGGRLMAPSYLLFNFPKVKKYHALYIGLRGGIALLKLNNKFQKIKSEGKVLSISVMLNSNIPGQIKI